MKNKKLKTRIIAVMMPITILLLVVNSIYHYNIMKTTLLDKYEESQISAESHIIDTLYLIDAGYRMLEIKLESELNEKALAFLKVYTEAGGKIDNNFLQQIKKDYGNDYDFLVIDNETTIIYSTLPEGQNFNFTDFSPELGGKINKIREGNEVWFEQLRTNVGNGKLSKFAYIPSADHKVLLEVAYSTEGFSAIIDELKPNSIIEQMLDVSPQIRDIKIYDLYGYQYVDSGENYKPTEEILALVKQAQAEKEMTLQVNDLISKKYLYVNLNQYRKKTLADTDRVIEITYDQTLINEKLSELLYSTIASAFTISLFIVIGILYFTNRLTKPIEALKRGAEKIAQGDYSSKVPVLTDDEVGELAESFNIMIEEINLSFTKIEGQNAILEDYNRNLEKKVNDRTKEIALRNTELEDKNHELEIAWIKANEARESKSNFLAMMSHEIRTPINSIVGMVYLLFRTKLDGRQIDFVNKIKDSAENLLQLVNDVLDLSKLEAGKTQLEAIEFNLEEIFELVSNQIGLKASEKNIELIFSYDGDIPKHLIGDPLRLRQVLLNLLNNAVKFTERGEIVVKTELISQKNHEFRILFSVKDTGVGIESSKLSSLFQPFQQADDSITRKYGGTGLGLSICKHFVELMKGEIWAESEINKGSTFSFTGIFREGDGKPTLSIKHLETFHDMKVLLTDDCKTSRDVLYEMLYPYFDRLDFAASGEEALALVEAKGIHEKAYDLILVDWKMPGMDGIETSRLIKAKNHMQKVPTVLMLTGYDLDEVKRIDKNHDVDAFLSKPIIQSTLLMTIAQLMGLRVDKISEKETKEEQTHLFLEPLDEVSILIAEDNLINQQILKVLLEHPLFRVDVVSNGSLAEKSVAQYDYDLILMDVQMPELDGIEATRRIRGSGRHHGVPIIAMTAHALEEDRLKCLSAGMNDFISKPIVDILLYELIIKWLPDKALKISQLNVAQNMKPMEMTYGISALQTKQPLLNLHGDWNKYLDLLSTFKNQYGNASTTLTEWLMEGRREEALKLIHSIRGIVGNLGAMDLFIVAQKLEPEIQLERVDPNHPNVVAFKSEFHKLLEEIDRLTNETINDARGEELTDHMTLAQLIEKLREKLQNGQADTERLIPQVESHFTDEKILQMKNQMIAYIRNYDYEDALILLEKVASYYQA